MTLSYARKYAIRRWLRDCDRSDRPRERDEWDYASHLEARWFRLGGPSAPAPRRRPSDAGRANGAQGEPATGMPYSAPETREGPLS